MRFSSPPPPPPKPSCGKSTPARHSRRSPGSHSPPQASILTEARRNLYDGITLDELSLAPILAARTLVEQEPNCAFVSARLLLDRLRREALSFVSGRPEQATQDQMAERYSSYFAEGYILACCSKPLSPLEVEA